ncbi:hypothetical protein [Clostridium sp.]|uniref:hypothetical protein n=1 Tax=Clostridium sp. TaxID=1506 RepID=UPI003D6CD281
MVGTIVDYSIINRTLIILSGEKKFEVRSNVTLKNITNKQIEFDTKTNVFEIW